jgi:hypothetical protein
VKKRARWRLPAGNRIFAQKKKLVPLAGFFFRILGKEKVHGEIRKAG